jgi:hypothetical protein
VTTHPVVRPRWPHLLFRGTTACLGVLSVVQAALAGRFLGGQYDALRAHLVTAGVMVAVAVVQAVIVVFLRRAGGPRPVLLIGLLFPLLLAGQGGLGMGRVLVLHVPLGVLFVVGLLRLAAWAWRTPLPVRVDAAGTAQDSPVVGTLS